MRRRLILLAVGLLLWCGPAQAQVLNYSKTLFPQTTIAGAVTLIGEVTSLGQIPGTQAVTVEAAFLYGSGGTTCKAYLQTSVDGGTTWVDVASFAFTTSAASKVSALNVYAALAAAVTPTDGTLADNTIVNGLIGDRLRVKVISTGTYAAATSIKVTLVQR
jgi:hypothetical protein